MGRRGSEKQEAGREMRGPEMQEGPGEVETGAGMWAKQTSQHGKRSIRSEAEPGSEEDTWVVNRGR